MPILSVILVIVVVGILLWVLNSYVPMDGNVKKILNIVVVLILVVWLLKALGVLSFLSGVTV